MLGNFIDFCMKLPIKWTYKENAIFLGFYCCLLAYIMYTLNGLPRILLFQSDFFAADSCNKMIVMRDHNNVYNDKSCGKVQQ